MKALDKVPNSLFGRFAPDSVPVECHCGVHFFWERARGDAATCPSCKATEQIDLGGPTHVDPALKVGADEVFSDASLGDNS